MANRNNSLSPNEILGMTEDQRSKLFSVCWHDGNYSEMRCGCTGVNDFKVKDIGNGRFVVSWSNDDGDPDVEVFSLDEKLHQSGDGTWDYGVYDKCPW